MFLPICSTFIINNTLHISEDMQGIFIISSFSSSARDAAQAVGTNLR